MHNFRVPHILNLEPPDNFCSKKHLKCGFLDGNTELEGSMERGFGNT